MSFEHISVCKNLFLGAISCWDSRIFLLEINQKVKFSGTIGYADSYMVFLFRLSKYSDYM